MLFHRVLPEERTYFQPGIVAIEQTATYPLGDDFFQLDHGNDYFAFFDRLGDVSYYVVLDGDRVAAVGAGVLRQVPDYLGATPYSAWYLCDLKVHPDYQRQHLSLRLLRYAIAQNMATCDRGYTISMNPGDGRANRLVQVLTRFPDVSFHHSATLGIYSLDAVSMLQLEPVLTKHRGHLSYFSLEGAKDLRIHSNGKVLPLLHVQWGATVQTTISTPLPGYIHMFCAPQTDDLAVTLAQQGVYPGATASALSHGMTANDWRFILTSDI
ncbi:GNAT family N-acetyltransferase [Leptolyngbya sp. PL-A3]|uniref:GNAT family N-acetyltransferase n=1 Tax=Leptolyngbya sp. PL-A3 TaxID=2933911 RepID=UPI0032980653